MFLSLVMICCLRRVSLECLIPQALDVKRLDESFKKIAHVCSEYFTRLVARSSPPVRIFFTN